jgi:hypothetical protein
VVPTALAHAEQTGADGEALLRAVVGGYEVVCRAADALLPGISQRGFRITAALAPLAAAATVALLRGFDDERAVEALRLAAGAAGGPLRSVDAVGEAWSLQPAPAVGVGTVAARAAAAGLTGATLMLEAANGVHGSLVGGSWPGLPDDDGPRIMRVTFKQHPVAMYGQSIFDALADPAGLPPAPQRVDVHVSDFAAAYGQPADADGDAIASVAGITRKALANAGIQGTPQVTIVADPDMGPLDARVVLDDVERRGTGDTSGWSTEQVGDYAGRRAGAGGPALVAACGALAAATDVAAVWDAVRAAG